MSYHQTIYNLLRGYGLSRAGALGILGNWQAESGCEPNRLQNDFSAYRTASKDYTARVMSGAITRDQFARDQKGYGLAQWTYFNFQTGQGRKLDLYDFWKKSGKALDDVTMQVAFAMHELATQWQYAPLLKILQTTDDIWTATDKMCRLYEQPYCCNVDARYKYAKEIESQLDLTGWTEIKPSRTEVKPSQTEVNEPEVFPDEWPPRMIDKNMDGMDVVVLKAVLSARGFADFFGADSSGYLDGQTDLFDDKTEKAVKQFQAAYGLEVDGVVGPKTWTKLLDRG